MSGKRAKMQLGVLRQQEAELAPSEATTRGRVRVDAGQKVVSIKAFLVLDSGFISVPKMAMRIHAWARY